MVDKLSQALMGASLGCVFMWFLFASAPSSSSSSSSSSTSSFAGAAACSRAGNESTCAETNPYASMSVFWPALWTSVYLLMVRHLLNHPLSTADDKPLLAVEGWMLALNCFQTAFNLWNFAGIVASVARSSSGMRFVGNTHCMENIDADLSFYLYAHYLNKYLEMLDTFFMLCRNKRDQVSFLHVFHHAVMPWPWFLVLTLHPCGDPYFGAAFNSLVHVLMYAYYALALLRIPCPWKVYITRLQLFQFVCVFVYGWVSIALGFSPRWLALVQEALMAVLFVLFSVFYSSKYVARADA